MADRTDPVTATPSGQGALWWASKICGCGQAKAFTEICCAECMAETYDRMDDDERDDGLPGSPSWVLERE